MKASICFFICFCTFSTCLSESINVDQPYSSGKSTVKRYHFDSLQFSNGVKINFSIMRTGNAETPEVFAGMAFDSFESAGYKYLKSAKYTVLTSNVQDRKDNIVYYSSTDTFWLESTVFPDSIIPLDNILDGDEESNQATTKKGRYFLQSFSTINFPAHTEETPIVNYNILIYIATIKNNMKLQITRLFMNSYPRTTPMDDYVLDSMEIRWTVDSLGNGKFVEPLSVLKGSIFQTRDHLIKSFEYMSPLLNSQNGRISIFDIKGRKLPEDNKYKMSSGLILYKQEFYVTKCGKFLNTNYDLTK